MFPPFDRLRVTNVLCKVYTTEQYERFGTAMKSVKYSLSFTTGSLFFQESIQLAQLYLNTHDWNRVRDMVIEQNLLQCRTLNTSKRICREIISRLKTLSLAQLDLLVSADHRDQAYLLWLAICRRYQFIADFASEVLRERFVTLKLDVSYDDFESFFNRKAEWHPEFEKIKPVTKTTLRQTLFRMLREADLITAKSTINPVMPSHAVLEAIYLDNPKELLIFPMFEADVKRRLS